MKKENREVFEALAMIVQFGIYMLVPIFLCTFIGIWLGKKYDISWMMIPFFFIGALAGGTNVYKMAKKIYSKNNGKGKKDVKKTK